MKKIFWIFMVFCYGTVCTADVAFFAFSPNAANHFSTFVNELEKDGEVAYLFLGEGARTSFERGVSFDLSNCYKETHRVLEQFPKITTIVTDISKPNVSEIHEVFSKSSPNVRRVVYYDNPEEYVSGGYSDNAAQVLTGPVDLIAFSNANLANTPIYKSPTEEIDTSSKEKVAIGFYPVPMADRLKQNRSDKRKVRRLKKQLKVHFSDKQMPSRIWTFVGGANEYFFSTAWPFFLDLVKNTFSPEDRVLILLQQHPRALEYGGEDEKALKVWKQENPSIASLIELSPFSTIEALTISDHALYSQTSMAPMIMMGNIPISHVGPEKLPDLLTKQDLCPWISEPAQLQQAMSYRFRPSSYSLIHRKLGIRADWKDQLKKVVQD